MNTGGLRMRHTIARRGATVLAVAVIASGCAGPAAQVSQGQSDSPTPATASPSASNAPSAPALVESPSVEPSAPVASTPAPSVTDFGYSDVLQVNVDGLAVRSGPSVTSSLAKVYRWNGETHVAIGDARLSAGDYVSVELGPLQIGDTVWYLVWPAEDARLHYNPGGSWDANGDFETDGSNDPGWVAASVAQDQHLTLYRPTDPSEYESWPEGGPRTLLASGTGDYLSEPLVQHDMYDFDWAAAVQDRPVPCSFSVTLLPEDGAEPVLAIEAAVADTDVGPVSGIEGIVDTPWAGSAGQTGDPLFRVSVRSECTWTLKLAPLAHD
jgi:hypothetical protein